MNEKNRFKTCSNVIVFKASAYMIYYETDFTKFDFLVKFRPQRRTDRKIKCTHCPRKSVIDVVQRGLAL